MLTTLSGYSTWLSHVLRRGQKSVVLQQFFGFFCQSLLFFPFSALLFSFLWVLCVSPSLTPMEIISGLLFAWSKALAIHF
jgi:hypothetical protein